MITTFTIDALIDAGLNAQAFKTIKAAFDLDIENARNDVRELLREQFVTVDAGEPTPAAIRMRKIREKQRLLKVQEALNDGGAEANTVREQFVTSDNILSLSKGIEKEESKPVVIARGRKKPDYSGIFEQFWTAFPTDKGMAKLEAWRAWEKINTVDMFAAIEAIPGFKKWAAEQGPTYRMVHACRYISQRRFDGFPPESKIPLTDLDHGVRVEAGTDQWDEWEAHLLKTTGKKPWRDLKGGRYFPTPYPPVSRDQAA